jgi:hypothetical protein
MVLGKYRTLDSVAAHPQPQIATPAKRPERRNEVLKFNKYAESARR